MSEIRESLPSARVYHNKITKLKVGGEEVELIRTINNTMGDMTRNKLTSKVKRKDKQKSNENARHTVQTATETRKQPNVRKPRSRQRSQKSGDQRQA